DATTVPVAPHRSMTQTEKPPEVDPVAMLQIDAMPLAAATASLPGAIDVPPAPTDSRGRGRGPGSGSGDGDGDGPGRGNGLGDGVDRGSGGDVYRPGGDVTWPIEIFRGVPRYTADAMRARVQGTVLVECVVETNGTCDRARVIRAFDPAFGLDREAID